MRPTSVIDSASLAGESNTPAITYDKKIQTATLTFDHPLATGPRKLRLAYHGTIYTERQRLVRARLPRPQGKPEAAAARAVHAVRELRRAPLRALLGRARRQGDLRALGHAARGSHAGLQHAGRGHRERSPAACSACVSRSRRRCPPTCCSSAPGDFERVHRMVDGVDVGIVVKRGDTANAAYRTRCHRVAAAVLQRLLRHALSTAQARPASRAREPASSSAPWRTGARSSTSSTTC